MEQYKREKAAGRRYLEGDNQTAHLCTKRFDRLTGDEIEADTQEITAEWLDMQITAREQELAGFKALRVDFKALPVPEPVAE